MSDPHLYDDAAYLLGALDDADRDAFEAHLVTCAECRSRLAELRPTAGLLAGLRAHGEPDDAGTADAGPSRTRCCPGCCAGPLANAPAAGSARPGWPGSPQPA
jgi:anti-sigma factor RsiW